VPPSVVVRQRREETIDLGMRGVCAALLLSACNLAPSAWCDMRPREARCQERLHSVSAETFKGTCATAMDKAGDGECPKTDQVGGCDLGKQGDGSTVRDWYYPPMTLDQVMEQCSTTGVVFLDPGAP
jgi:hypothetical protein